MIYHLIPVVGEDNATKAIDDYVSKDEGWTLHSIVPSGIVTQSHPLNPNKAIAHMKFLVVMERMDA